MKLINYNYGYYPAFECSIHGKIQMNYGEWREAVKYLKSGGVARSFLPSYPWKRSMLLEDIDRAVSAPGNSFRVNIRVSMTEKLVSRYNLPKYKRGNYMIEVTPK